VAKQCAISEIEPIDRLKTLFILMFSDVMQLLQEFDSDELTEKDVRDGIYGSVETVSMVLLGIPQLEQD
jgi:hypothetical protein